MQFAHRYLAGGVIESICMKCLTSIGRERTINKMLIAEARHCCEGQVAKEMAYRGKVIPLNLSATSRSA